jgi:putative nucleotidyltransferase with HDIG domain
MDENRSDRPSVIERLKLAWQATRLWLIFAMGLLGSAFVISLPEAQLESTLVLESGDAAPQDILAPYALSFQSEYLTELERQNAADAVQDIYDPPDSNVARQQLEALRATLDFIDAVRADVNATSEQRLSDLSAIARVNLNSESAQEILDFTDFRWEALKFETISVLEQVMRNEIREGRVEEARRTVPALVSINLTEPQSALVAKLASAFVAHNTTLNQEATDAAREAARAEVGEVSKSYTSGETIVSRGELVTDLDIEGLQAYGLLVPPDPLQSIAIRSLFVVVLGGAITLYIYRAHFDQIKIIRQAFALSIIFILLTASMQLMIPNQIVLPYLFPAATVPMLLTVLFSPGMGIMTSLVTGALAGFLAPRGLELALYVILSGTMATLVIGRAERLSSFFWAGLAASLSAATIIAIFRFPDPATDILGKAELLGAAIIQGMLSASLGFGLLLLVGNLLGITTSLQLIELSRPDHPLLQLILRNAPGTYQHSLQVANLAEQAARAIGANALLTRVGALYHDAGKALRPQFFIENQVSGQNVHEQLDPKSSASIILGHVTDGLDLARKHRLPQSIQDFISEHHGLLNTSYQYKAALDAVGGDPDRVNKSDFVYPGPKPRSAETALLMLADGVEAKVRADMPEDEETIDQIVRWVVQNRLERGQLDRTDLTLKDLDTIQRSFTNTLKNIYHPRIRYPEEAPEIDEAPPLPDSSSETQPEAS